MPALKDKDSYDGENASTEDIHSVDRHIKFMQKKMQRKHPKISTLLTIMEQTFKNRRDWIKSEGVSVKTVIQTYPVLTSMEGVSLCDEVSIMHDTV